MVRRQRLATLLHQPAGGGSAMWNARLSFRHRWLWVAAGVAALVIVLAYTAAFLIDEPLRRSIERRMNAQLKGYTVRLGGASFHPHGFSLDVFNVSSCRTPTPIRPSCGSRGSAPASSGGS